MSILIIWDIGTDNKKNEKLKGVILYVIETMFYCLYPITFLRWSSRYILFLNMFKDNLLLKLNNCETEKKYKFYSIIVIYIINL